MDSQLIGPLSFVSLRDGFGVDGGDVVATVDGGITWGRIATAQRTQLASDPAVNLPDGIAFTGPKDGYLWSPSEQGPDLAVTSDGGMQWQLVGQPANVATVLPFGSNAWAVTASQPGGPTVAPRLWQSGDAGRSWTLSPTPLPTSDPAVLSAARVDESTAYVVVGTGRDDGASGLDTAVLETTDAGRTWIPRQLPPDACGQFGAFIQAPEAADPWLDCSADPSAGSQDKAVYRSTDSGRTWEVVASDYEGQPKVGELPVSGYVDQVYAASTTTAYIAEGRGPVIESTDGGATWRTVASNYDTGDSPSVLAPPLGPSTSVALVSGQSWTTTNGVTWSPTT